MFRNGSLQSVIHTRYEEEIFEWERIRIQKKKVENGGCELSFFLLVTNISIFSTH